jgi:membrane-associated phospholipid phosphatase
MARKKDVDRAAETLARADGHVDEAVAPYRGSPPVKALSFVSDLGDQPQLRLISGGLIAAGLVRSDARMLRAGLRMLIAHELTTFAKNLVKERVDRTRPRSAQSIANRKIKRGNTHEKEESSFPSGHSAGAIAVARAFTREYPGHSTPAIGAAGLVAAAQVPRCAHYISDVAAGLALGIATEAAANAAWDAVEARLRGAEPREFELADAGTDGPAV